MFPDLDCWGLARCILEEREGVELPEFCDFSQKTMGDPAVGMIAQHVFQEIPAPEDYCVVCYYRHGVLFHVGIFLQGDILHTTNRHGFRKHPLESFYPQCVRRFYRYAGQDIHPPVSDMAN